MQNTPDGGPAQIWWMADCDGPYTEPCLHLYDSDIAENNLRLYQWCMRCLLELSIRLGGEDPDPACRLLPRPLLAKSRVPQSPADTMRAHLNEFGK